MLNIFPESLPSSSQDVMLKVVMLVTDREQHAEQGGSHGPHLVLLGGCLISSHTDTHNKHLVLVLLSNTTNPLIIMCLT